MNKECEKCSRGFHESYIYCPYCGKKLPTAKEDKELYMKLKEFRDTMAEKERKPRYIIFPNETLKELSKCQPKTISELEKTRGMGPKKIEEYGKDILGIINEKKEVSEIIDEKNFDDVKEPTFHNCEICEKEINSRYEICYDCFKEVKKLKDKNIFEMDIKGILDSLNKEDFERLKKRKLNKLKQKETQKEEKIDKKSKWLEKLKEIRLKYPHSYEPWTEEEESTLKELYKKGETIEDISKILGRQPGGINSRLESLELLEKVNQPDGA